MSRVEHDDPPTFDGGDPESWVAAYIEEATDVGAPPALFDWLERVPPSLRGEVERRVLAFLRFESLTHDPLVAPSDRRSTVPPTLPSQFGEFRILRRLAAGGMSAVYLAEQRSLGRVVALKILPPAFAPSGSTGERFRREAQIVARLRHPNIVGIHAYGEEHGTSYLALDYVEGETLAERILRWREDRSASAGDPHEIARLGVTVGEALGYAHAHGVIHRDVKPSNIIIDTSGEPHIVDFGLAKDALALSMSRTGDMLGTPQYMAPEQVDATFGEVDARTDVYGLGATLYESLALRPPHGGSTMERVVHHITRLEAPSLAALRSQVPRDLATIVHTALEKHPDHRYQSTTEMVADLRRFLDGRPILTRPVSLWRRVGRFARRRPALVQGLALLIVLAIAIPAVVLTRVSLEHERERADREQRERDGLRLLSEANAVLASDPGLALRLAVEGAEQFPGVIANDTLYAAWRADDRAGVERKTIRAHRGHIHKVLFDPTGTWIGSASADGTAAIWRASDGECVARLEGHEGPVLDLAFAPDSRRVLTAALDGAARIWDVESPAEPEWSVRADGPVHAARWVLDGRAVIVASLDGTLACYDASPPHAMRWRTGDLPTVSLGRYSDIWSEVDASIAVSPDGRSVLAGTVDRRVTRWDAESGDRVWSTAVLPERVSAIQIARNGSRLVSYGTGSETSWQGRVWDADDGHAITTVGRASTGSLRGVAISDDGARVTTSGGLGSDVWNASTGEWLGQRLRTDCVMPRQHFRAFAPHSREFATTHIGGPLLLGSAQEQARSLRSDESWVTWLDFDPTGMRLVTGGQTGTLRIWSLSAPA
ncbi:MAG: protein kinase, partial [Planctomycetes bacterium]|nr:protein kinase [Planctomycetota bacterium]